MANTRDRTHRSSTALVNAERPTLLPQAVERHTHTDARTHTKTFYERDRNGGVMYGAYYNSDDDPSFQARYNSNGNRAYVTTSHFTYVSGGGQQKPFAPQRHTPLAAVVEEEEDGDTTSIPPTSQRGKTHRATPMAQPVVEEPDDEDADAGRHDEYAYMDRLRSPHRSSGRHHHHHHHHDDYALSAYPPRRRHRSSQLYDDTARQPYAMSPFMHQGMLINDFFMDDFFAGPSDPFAMLGAMRQHMSRQRAAMFGGADPFATFF